MSLTNSLQSAVWLGGTVSRRACIQNPHNLHMGVLEHLEGGLGEPDLGHSVQSALRLSAGHTLQ